VKAEVKIRASIALLMKSLIGVLVDNSFQIYSWLVGTASAAISLRRHSILPHYLALNNIKKGEICKAVKSSCREEHE